MHYDFTRKDIDDLGYCRNYQVQRLFYFDPRVFVPVGNHGTEIKSGIAGIGALGVVGVVDHALQFIKSKHAVNHSLTPCLIGWIRGTVKQGITNMAADDYATASRRADVRDSELVLPPGVFAFVLDETKGNINTLCGPIKQSLSNTDRLVVFDSTTKRFVPMDRQQGAIQTNIVAPKGYYVILENPPLSGKQPEPGKAEIMPVGTLNHGQIVNIPGPVSFPLWPGQIATVVKGHHLRSNQYLVVRVYDDETAKTDWGKSVIKSVGGTEAETRVKAETDGKVLGIDKNALVTGQLLIIKGTGVAFYIPSSGVEVMIENDEYVRDAVTLERLEYAILIGEDGNKTYKKGPDVVFPTPTQKFFTKDGKRKFRAYELQPTNGIHVKVIADYVDEDGKPRKAGDELFITGADMPIYYPREEHAIISYGGADKTFAVAIPSGEGRYVLNRLTGNIALIIGPSMFLPNPIEQVIVRRILSQSECELYYPGNRQVQQFNQTLITESTDVTHDVAMMDQGTRAMASAMNAVGGLYATSASSSASPAKATFADQLSRSTQYTPPRMLTLNSKFDGAVRIDVWSGFAVQVVNSKGDRRAVIGPTTVLLEYDEYLERLVLSTGTPKRDDKRITTPYLRYVSNPISDILNLKTCDLVNVDVQVKYLVRFETADTEQWFAIDNYIQYLVDHLRSMIGNKVRTIDIQTFYADAANILREIVLGKTPEGSIGTKHFVENGMTVYDLEIVGVNVHDRNISEILAKFQQEHLMDSISLERANAKTKLIAGLQEAERAQAEEVATTEAARLETTRQRNELTDNIEREKKIAEEALTKLTSAIDAILLEQQQAKLELDRTYMDFDMQREIAGEMAAAEAQKIRMGAVVPSLVEALTAMAQTGQLEAIAEHLAPLSIVQGTSLAGTLENLMEGTPLEGMINNLKRLNKLTVISDPSNE